jgi:hypothetical protein
MSYIAPSAPEAPAGMSDLPVRFDENQVALNPRTHAAARVALPQLGFHEDDNSVFFAKALEYSMAQTYQRPIPAMAADRLVPTDNETPEWAESVSYEVYDIVGMAKIIAAYSDDLPRADIRGVEKVVPVVTLGNSFGYTTKDLRTALNNRTNLPVLRAVAARTHVARKENSLKIRGDSAHGMFGIINHPNIPVVTPVTGTWGTATGDQIVDDLNKLVNAIVTQSNGTHTPSVLGVSSLTRSRMATKRMSGAQQTTVMQFFREQFPEIDIVVVEELRGQGAAGSEIVFAAERNATNYHYKAVMPFRQHPPQARNLEFVVPCEARTAGLVVMQPLATATMGAL